METVNFAAQPVTASVATTHNTLLEAALKYAKRGWAVLPLHSPVNGECSCGKATCSSVGKHPRTRNGLADATTEATKIQQWWKQWPDANIGILTGSESGLLVLDVDDKNGGKGSESLAELTAVNGELDTMMVKTGSGTHLYFQHPGVPIKNSVQLVGPGLDVRAERGYVVAAPSVHANGNTYEVVKEQELAAAPQWLMTVMMKGKTEKTEIMDEGNNNPFTDAPIVNEGQRNNTLFELASALRGQHGMEQDQIEPILLTYNTEKCEPPLAEEEVLKIVESACKFPAEVNKKSAMRQGESPLYWFPFNLRWWFSDPNIYLMTDFQKGWFIQLRAFAWQGGGFLTADKSKLWKLANAKSKKAFESDCDLVLTDFDQVLVNGQQMLKNSKMAADYAHALSEWMKKKEAGQASHEKWEAQKASKQQGSATIQ